MANAGLVLCVRVPELEKPGEAQAAVVPQSRLAAKDKWAAYSVEKADTFIVADRYGNEYKRTDKCELSDLTKQVGSHFRRVRKDMRTNNATAEKAIKAGKTAEAIAALLENFATGVVGYDEAAKAVELYNGLIEEGRKQIAKVDAAELKKLADIYKGTDLADDIARALKDAKASND